MTPAQAMAAATLAVIGPDPHAAQHLADLKRAIGLRCTVADCTTNHRVSADCGIHGPNETRDRIMAGSLRGRAASAERFARQRQDRAEDVEFLLEQRTDPAVIAERLGLSPAALAKSLSRAGRLDLARHFWRAAKPNPNNRRNAA